MFPSLRSHVILYKQYIWKFFSEHFAFPVGKCERKFSVQNKKQVNVCQFTLEEMQGCYVWVGLKFKSNCDFCAWTSEGLTASFHQFLKWEVVIFHWYITSSISLFQYYHFYRNWTLDRVKPVPRFDEPTTSYYFFHILFFHSSNFQWMLTMYQILVYGVKVLRSIKYSLLRYKRNCMKNRNRGKETSLINWPIFSMGGSPFYVVKYIKCQIDHFNHF